MDAKDYQVGDAFDVPVNQATREGYVVARSDDWLIVEYLMPAGSSGIQLWHLNGREDDWLYQKTLNYNKLQRVHCKAIVGGAFPEFVGRSQSGKWFGFSPQGTYEQLGKWRLRPMYGRNRSPILEHYTGYLSDRTIIKSEIWS